MITVIPGLIPEYRQQVLTERTDKTAPTVKMAKTAKTEPMVKTV